jgi:LysM repeat protein
MTSRSLSVVAVSALLSASCICALAQIPPPTPPAAAGQAPAQPAGTVQEELRALRQIIEQQSKQIDNLTAQVTRLGGELERRGQVPPAPASTINAEEAPTAKPVAPESTNVHIVVKGDSLDKIAKTHGTSVSELMKLNKITDPKKLQIGQQITLPPKPEAATQPEKKEGQ